MRKQSILYWFPSKEVLLEALIDRSAAELADRPRGLFGPGRDRAGRWMEAVVRSVFRLAARRPELLGLLREVGRLGPRRPPASSLALEPLVGRASAFLEAEMDAGAHAPPRAAPAAARHLFHRDRHDHRGRGPAGPRRGTDGPSLVRRRQEILRLLRSALMVDPVPDRGAPLRWPPASGGSEPEVVAGRLGWRVALGGRGPRRFRLPLVALACRGRGHATARPGRALAARGRAAPLGLAGTRPPGPDGPSPGSCPGSCRCGRSGRAVLEDAPDEVATERPEGQGEQAVSPSRCRGRAVRSR